MIPPSIHPFLWSYDVDKLDLERDKKRLDLLPLFKNFKKDFYLGGGTALALQIGHRDSVDFDFFKEGNLDTQKLFNRLEEFFAEHHLLKIQIEI